MYRILLQENSKLSRETQHRLNPPLIEVVKKKEVLNLLNVGIIYSISDSKRVRPVQMVAKMIGIIVVENPNSELIPIQVQNGWQDCVDFRTLNA